MKIQIRIKIKWHQFLIPVFSAYGRYFTGSDLINFFKSKIMYHTVSWNNLPDGIGNEFCAVDFSNLITPCVSMCVCTEVQMYLEKTFPQVDCSFQFFLMISSFFNNKASCCKNVRTLPKTTQFISNGTYRYHPSTYVP